MKIDYRMQYYDVITSPRWRTADNMKLVISAYLGESDMLRPYDEILCTESDSDSDNKKPSCR